MTKEQQNAIDFFKLTIDMDDDKESEDCQTIQSAKTAIDAIQKVSALQEVLDEMEDEFILNVKDAYENGYNSAIREFMDKIEEKCGLETYGLRTVAEEEENWAKITDVINAVCGGNGADYIVADDRHLFLKCRSVDTDFGVYDICKIGGDTGLELPDSEIDEFFEQSEKAMSERFSLSEESINEITSQPWEDWADRAEALGEKPLADYLKPVCDYLYGLLEPLTKEEIDGIRKNMTERDKMDVLSYKVLRCLVDEVIITEKAEDDEYKYNCKIGDDWFAIHSDIKYEYDNMPYPKTIAGKIAYPSMAGQIADCLYYSYLEDPILKGDTERCLSFIDSQWNSEDRENNLEQDEDFDLEQE